MIHQQFSIFDQKAAAYFPPFYLQNKALAIRTFGDMVNNPESRINKHPEDYTLFHLGQWNDNSSEHELFKSIKSLGNGLEFCYNDNNERISQNETEKPKIKEIA